MKSSLKYFGKAFIMFVCSIIQLFGALFRVIREVFGWCSKSLDRLCDKVYESLKDDEQEPETIN